MNSTLSFLPLLTLRPNLSRLIPHWAILTLLLWKPMPMTSALGGNLTPLDLNRSLGPYTPYCLYTILWTLCLTPPPTPRTLFLWTRLIPPPWDYGIIPRPSFDLILWPQTSPNKTTADRSKTDIWRFRRSPFIIGVSHFLPARNTLRSRTPPGWYYLRG